MSADVIRYHPAREGAGLRVHEGTLEALRGGAVVARADVGSTTLGDLLSSGLAYELIADAAFALGPPIELEAVIDVEPHLSMRGEVAGWVEEHGRRHPWLARRVADRRFQRSQAGSVWGWAVRVPAEAAHGDRVLHARMRQAIASVVTDIVSERAVTLPLRVRLSSVFSAACPPPAAHVAPELDRLPAAHRDV